MVGRCGQPGGERRDVGEGKPAATCHPDCAAFVASAGEQQASSASVRCSSFNLRRSYLPRFSHHPNILSYCQLCRVPPRSVHGNVAHNLVNTELAISQAFSPRTPFVQCVPRRSLLVSSPASWVVAAKTINDRIPDRTVHCNQNLLRKTNPHRIKNQPAASARVVRPSRHRSVPRLPYWHMA